jgi:hypothetical protein
LISALAAALIFQLAGEAVVNQILGPQFAELGIGFGKSCSALCTPSRVGTMLRS